MWTQIRPVKIRVWFPPGDPVATSVARLCILREDLWLELYGAAASSIPKLDDNTEGYRRLYFWRNHLRTIEEARRALNRLNANTAFRNALSAEPRVWAAFQSATKRLNKASDSFLRTFRNYVGGHVDEPALQAALDNMDHRSQGYMQSGDILEKRHYRFADLLLLGALEQSAGHPTDLNRLVQESLEVVSEVMGILDDVISCYFAERRIM